MKLSENCKEKTVFLSRQILDLSLIKAGVPQSPIIGPLLFVIYINDLLEGLSSNAQLFADNASFFFVIHDSNTSTLELNKGLAKINRWAFQWKMSFILDPKKQAQEVIFSRISKAIFHSPKYLIICNTSYIPKTSWYNS